ncbi:MAG: filamentous hemagglutinin N-terminal domain-containing protein, partial [Synechococcus sp.]|nr:filamentous hemagglutinin N-terminal domain-containing protein [Synechococcus sp.]
MKRTLNQGLERLGFTALLGLSVLQVGRPVQALPEYAGQGSVGVSGLVDGANREIHVNSQRAFVRWQRFNVEAGETFRIKGNASQTLLNLVTGSDPSRIAGMVDSGARFILANPNGISVLKGGQILAPSVRLTTARFDPQQWIKGQSDSAGVISASGYLSFDPGSAINVEGTIHAKADTNGVGGSIQLLADQVNLGSSAVLNATGPKGGGEILVGGSWQNSQPELGQATEVS